MTKKHNPNSHERPRQVSVERKAREACPSERAQLRAATVCQEQREASARREALALLDRENVRRDALAHAGVPAPTVREDLHAVRRRPLDAPMATYPGALPDPFAQQVWDAISAALVAPARSLWAQVQTPLAFAVWSLACFWLGRLAA